MDSPFFWGGILSTWLRPEVEDNKNLNTTNGLKQPRYDVMIEAVTFASLPGKHTNVIDVRHCSMRAPHNIGRNWSVGALRGGENEVLCLSRGSTDGALCH